MTTEDERDSANIRRIIEESQTSFKEEDYIRETTMILDNINFNGYDIQVDHMDLKWKFPSDREFKSGNRLRCKSEITALFPYHDRLFIVTLNGCLYRVGTPMVGNLYLNEYTIIKSTEDE